MANKWRIWWKDKRTGEKGPGLLLNTTRDKAEAVVSGLNATDHFVQYWLREEKEERRGS